MSCTKLQLPPEPLTRGLPPPDLRSLCPQLNLLNPLRKKFLGTPLLQVIRSHYAEEKFPLSLCGTKPMAPEFPEPSRHTESAIKINECPSRTTRSVRSSSADRRPSDLRPSTRKGARILLVVGRRTAELSSLLALVCSSWAGITRSVWRLATGCTVRGSNTCGGEAFSTLPDCP